MKEWVIEVVRSTKEHVLCKIPADTHEEAEEQALVKIKESDTWHNVEWEEYDTEYYIGSYEEIKTFANLKNG
jgi:hypothetical protein